MSIAGSVDFTTWISVTVALLSGPTYICLIFLFILGTFSINIGLNKLQEPFPRREWRRYNAGYYVDWLHQYALCYLYYMAAVATVLTFIGLCLYIKAMAIDLKDAMAAVDGDRTMNELDGRKSERPITDMVQFHNEILK